MAPTPEELATLNVQKRHTLIGVMLAFFNMLILLTICFGIMPKLEQQNQDVKKSLAASERNLEVLKENHAEIQDHKKTILKMGEMLDDASIRARRMEGQLKKIDDYMLRKFKE